MAGENASKFATSKSLSATQQVFEKFVKHYSQDQISSEVTITNILRQEHPDFHVTCTLAEKIDLQGFAKAGHAQLVPSRDEYMTDSTRHYKAPHSRLDSEPGKLLTQYRFCRHAYTWENNEFIVYEVKYEDHHGRIIRLNFVLSPQYPGSAKEGEGSITDELLLAAGSWTKELHDEIYVFDDGHWTKNTELWNSVQDTSWDDVILEPKMKDNLIQDVQGFFDNQSLYAKLSVPWKRGLILHGVPGNGKTISIKALINALSARADPVPSLYVKSFSACNGEQYSIRSIFSKARTMAPCLLIFEDLDSLITDETRSYFLNEVDGLESNNGILMVGSTNHLNSLDPAISKRPSRFDRKYHFKLPNELERGAYCKFWRKKLANSDMVEFPEELCEIVGKVTEGFSFAYLKELFVIVLLSIARGNNGDEEEEEVKPEEKKSAEETSVDSTTQSDDGKSTDGHVVVEHADAKPDSTAVAEGTTVKTADSEVTIQTAVDVKQEPKKKRVLPQVDVPEHLKDNILLKVTMKQTKALLEEMDNTAEDEGPSGPKRIPKQMGMAMPPVMRTMRARAMRRAC